MSATTTYNDLIEEMLLALRANTEYLKTNGSSQIRIKNGKLKSVLESGYIYDFQLERLQEIDLDADVEVKIGAHSANGKVIAITDGSVTVSIDEHVGDDIPQATLIISSYFLLEKLSEHLTLVKNGDLEHSDVAEKVFKLKPSITTYDDSYIKPAGIDASQTKAIQMVLGSEVSFIWGPPGTGKSETISNLIETLIERGLSVLIIAHTNAATDSVMGKVVKLMEKKNHPDYNDGKFLRIGKKIHPDLKTKKVIPEVIMEERAQPIRDEMQTIRAEIDKLNQLLEYIAKVESYQKSLEQAQSEVQYSKAHLEKHKAVLTTKNAELANLHAVLADVDGRINNFQARNGISKLFAGTNLEKLTREKTGYLREIVNTKARIEIVNNDVQATHEHLDKNTELARRIKVKLNSLPYEVDAESAKHTKTKIKHYSEQLEALQKQLDELQDNLLLEAKVIATTLTQTYTSRQILSRKYDVVILDEASMAPLPAVASVAGLASQKIALVGDFFQLPPIAKHQVETKNKSDAEVKAEQDLIDKWLKQDIFGVVGIENAVVKGTRPDPLLSQLKTQYRMHPDISFLINKLVYGKNKDFELENGADTIKNGLTLLSKPPLSDAHIGVYDTTYLGSVPTKSDSGSWYNVPHAIASVELAKQAIESGYKTIGIISAYRAQVNLINQIIKDELGNDGALVEADTVHRFQGGAKQVVIFDVTTPYSNSMYDDMKEGGDDAKLINVAFSRSEEKCIILADCKTVEAKHSPTSLIKQAMGICKAKGAPIADAKALLDDYYADDRSENWLEGIAGTRDIVADVENAQLHDERGFYPLFIKDVLNAEKEVIIQSAFITSSRLNTLIPVFQHVMRRGVRIFVITRVSWEHDGAMRKQSEEGQKLLEKMGITVLPFTGKVHQKFAIIDRQVLWDGSLNILSQRDSKEVMRRYVGTSAVGQYMDFMRLSKNIGPLGEYMLKHCEACTLPGSWMWTKKVRGRMWTFCLTGNHSANMAPKTSEDRKKREQELAYKKDRAAAIRARIQLNAEGNPVCPEHNRLLIAKTGRFGEYWECPLSNECVCTISEAKLNTLRFKANRTKLV